MTPADLSREQVNSGRCRSCFGEGPRDGGFDPGVQWFDRFREHGGDAAVTPDQILVKVPAWGLLGTFLQGPIYRTDARAAPLPQLLRPWETSRRIACEPCCQCQRRC